MKTDILPPFVIITGAFVVIGVGLSGFHKLMNNGKVANRFLPATVSLSRTHVPAPLTRKTFYTGAQVRRTRLDTWDRLMWERDHRITGSYNEQRVWHAAAMCREWRSIKSPI